MFIRNKLAKDRVSINFYKESQIHESMTTNFYFSKESGFF